MPNRRGALEKAFLSADPCPALCADAVYSHDSRSKTLFQVLKKEKGFIEVQILATYAVFVLTLFAFLLGLAFGVWKQASAKYMWFAEDLDFAAQAANMTGNIREVALNQNKAKLYFTAAMNETVKDYTLIEFRTVFPGDPVPNGTARAPGYVAGVTVPVFNGRVPLIGVQQVRIPMRYYAVVKSGQLKK